MQVYEWSGTMEPPPRGWALTIGNFDGVHAGHQELIRACRLAAEAHGARGIAAMTFDPHPAAILHPERAPGVLSPMPYRRVLLERYGVDSLMVLRDSRELLNMSPDAFVDEFLMHYVEPKVVIEGPNFHFGYGRSGNVDTLRELGAERGFAVEVVGPKKIFLEDEGEVMCSSSLVRRLLESGRIRQATSVLTRPYRLMGPVIAGRGIGRILGYPTANIHADLQIVPAEGVYAGYVSVATSQEDLCRADNRMAAVFSIGRAKTFVSDHPLLIEAHVLDAELEDMYGQWLAMDFVEYLRCQQRFDSRESLTVQIARDCEKAREIIKKQDG